MGIWPVRLTMTLKQYICKYGRCVMFQQYVPHLLQNSFKVGKKNLFPTDPWLSGFFVARSGWLPLSNRSLRYLVVQCRFRRLATSNGFVPKLDTPGFRPAVLPLIGSSLTVLYFGMKIPDSDGFGFWKGRLPRPYFSMYIFHKNLSSTVDALPSCCHMMWASSSSGIFSMIVIT